MSMNLQNTIRVSLEGLSAPRLRTDTQVFVVNADRFCVADRLCFAAVGLCVGLLLVLMADSALELKLNTKICATTLWGGNLAVVWGSGSQHGRFERYGKIRKMPLKKKTLDLTTKSPKIRKYEIKQWCPAAPKMSR